MSSGLANNACAVQPFAVRARGIYIRLELRRSVRVYAVSAMRDAQLLTGIRDYLALNISPAILDSANRTTGISYRGLPCAFLDYPAAIHGSYEKPARALYHGSGALASTFFASSSHAFHSSPKRPTMSALFSACFTTP